MKNNLSKALKFLIFSLKQKPSMEELKFLYSYLSDEKFDFMKIVKLAHQHGILPLIYKSIKKQNFLINTQAFKNFMLTLKTSYMKISHKNMLMSAELICIIQLLKENNIQALAFKGPTLSQMAYGDITLRQFGDLDILVEEKNIFLTNKIISKQGYRLNGSIDFLKNPLWLKLTKDMTLQNYQKNIFLEMHWKLFHSDFAHTSKKINLWKNQEFLRINNISISTLNKNILLAYLCIHGSRHIWERVEWIVDIDRLLKKVDINWIEVLKISEQFQSKKMLLLGLSLSYTFFNTTLTTEIHEMIKRKKIIKLQNKILRLLDNPLSKSLSTKDILYRKILHTSMQDTLYNKIIFWKNILFKKNYTSLLENPSPNKTYSLFNLKRPFMLMKKFIFKYPFN